MPRNKLLSGTLIFPRDIKVNVPFLKEFMEQVLRPSDFFTATTDIFAEYIAFLAKQSSDQQTLQAGHSFLRFSRQFNTLAIRNRWPHVHHCGQRGYRLSICKATTRASRPRPDQDLVRKPLTLNEEVQAFLKSDQRRFTRIFISKQKGFGAISKHNIVAHTIVAEYVGQFITKYEALERERLYDTAGELCTMFKISPNLYLDGNRDSNGEPFEDGQNEGAVFNHSKNSPNCKMITTDITGSTRLFLVTITDISKGAEMTYDYSDRRRGLPQWLYD